MVECLPTMPEAPGSIPSTYKEEEKETPPYALP